jgi:hypothetical protein
MMPSFQSATPLQAHAQDRDLERQISLLHPYAHAGVATAVGSHIKSSASFESSKAFLYFRQELRISSVAVNAVKLTVAISSYACQGVTTPSHSQMPRISSSLHPVQTRSLAEFSI